MRERILAVFGALLLVGLAVFARGQLGSGDGGGGGKQGGGDKQSSELPVVACTPDLTSICAALAQDGSITAASKPLDLDRAGDPAEIRDIDGWITWSPAPAIAAIDADDAGNPGPWGKDVVLGSAELGVLADPTKLDCGQPVQWTCVAEKAQDGLTVGVGEVATAEGLARIAPFAPILAGNDPQNADIELGRALLDGPPRAQSDAAAMIEQASLPGVVDAVVAPAPAIRRAASTPGAKSQGLQPLSATPSVRAAVILVGRGADLSDVAKAMETARPAKALVDIGLKPDGTAPKVDAGALWQLRKQLR